MTYKFHIPNKEQIIQSKIEKLQNAVYLSLFSVPDETLKKLFGQFHFHYFIFNDDYTFFMVSRAILETPFIVLSIVNFDETNDLVLCFEGNCYILKNLENEENLMEIFLLKINQYKGKIYFIDSSKYQKYRNCEFQKQLHHKTQTIEIEEETKNFFVYFYSKISCNSILLQLIKPLSAYSIRRYYFKSSSFRNDSFFQSKFHQKNYFLENYQNPNLIEFKENDFIFLRSIYQGSSNTVNLYIHKETLYLMVIKSQNFPNSETEDDKTKNDNNGKEKVIENERINFGKYFADNIQHPFIVKCFGFIRKKNNFWFVYDFMSNGNLSSCIKSLSDKKKTLLILRILCALNYLHLNGFTHQDIKPDNILIDHDFNSFLSDFDRVKFSTESNGIIFGNKNYMSPEQYFEKSSTKVLLASDVFSFGLLLFFICEGKNLVDDLLNENGINHLNFLNFLRQNNIGKNDLMNQNEILYEYLKFMNSVINLSRKNDRFCILIQSCLKYDTNLRPTSLFLYKQFKSKLITIIGTKIENFFSSKEFVLSDELIVFSINKFFPKKNYEKRLSNDYLKNFLEKEKPFIYYNLGSFFQNISDEKENIKLAVYFYQISAEMNYLFAKFELAIIFYKNNFITPNVNKSIKYFEDISHDFPIALFNLGKIYQKSKYVQRDLNKAIYYLNKAAEQNYILAFYELGLIFYEGKETPTDFEKAHFYLKKAADLYYVKAQYLLGSLYLQNVFPPHGLNDSIFYLKLASKQSSVLAQNKLGSIYLSFSNSSNNQQDFINKAIKYFTLASKQKYPMAYHNLGLIYQNKNYFVYDLDKSFYYFDLANKCNFPQSQFYLGKLYLTGTNVTKNIEKAVKYFKLASKSNYGKAQFILGDIFSSGVTGKVDFAKGIKYFKKATKHQIPEAKEKIELAKLHLYCNLANYKKENYIQIIENLEKLSGKGNDFANLFLAIAYSDCFNVNYNFMKAINYINLIENKYQKDPIRYKNMKNIFILASILHGMILMISINLKNIHKAKKIFKNSLIKTNPSRKTELFHETDSNEYIWNNLGVIYYYYEYKENNKEIYKNKAINLFKLASKRSNFFLANVNLGIIYENEKKINKSIKYFKLALKSSLFENQNKPFSLNQNILISKKCIELLFEFVNLKLFSFYKNLSKPKLEDDVSANQIENINDYKKNCRKLLNIIHLIYNQYSVLSFDQTIDKFFNDFIDLMQQNPYYWLIGFYTTERIKDQIINDEFYQGFGLIDHQ
ncbi:hypothetical protein TRFO_07136 [Tritrichomonas foetus]|uniref:Protein kinase domain-containing protein n=1 Tax=Tritrichomonas foetus TaxID=1144522 RepID=A0A1J4JXS4_9EUKA|nr:hypothetical protein TRFO_07136 [Tritrichomonas foetus]|eukprot:OHT02318.1 hypothetical protein TRFO_07136 [Tritrichomonas foetus]